MNPPGTLFLKPDLDWTISMFITNQLLRQLAEGRIMTCTTGFGHVEQT